MTALQRQQSIAPHLWLASHGQEAVNGQLSQNGPDRSAHETYPDLYQKLPQLQRD